MSKRFFICNTGPTMSQNLVDDLYGENVIVVNNTYELAPWAFALAATDRKWWEKNPDALKFEGKKYTGWPDAPEPLEVLRTHTIVCSRTCSGVLAMEAAKRNGATEIILLGTDFHGSHYFGPYSNGLYNTSERHRMKHHRQFHLWYLANRRKINIVNCSPGTKLRHIPTGDLRDYL